VTGGSGNTAGGVYGTVCGGVGNSFTFPAQNAVVGGGFQRSTGGDHDWVAGTLFEDN